MRAEFRAADGRRLAYDDTGGAGPVVICLAGLTRDARDFADLAAHLAPRYRVLRLDYRGRGDSEWATDPVAEYTVPVESGDALALLDHLRLARAAVIGTSRGGLCGMVIGAMARQRLTCLVLNDVGPVIGESALAAIMAYLGRQPTARSFAEAAAVLEQGFGAEFPGLGADRWLAMAHRIYRDEGGRPRLSYDPRLREAVEAALESGPPDLWPLFDALAGLPILTIRGANSNILSPETLSEMARRRPDMLAVTVPDRGHVPFLDEPPALAAIDAFLERHAT